MTVIDLPIRLLTDDTPAPTSAHPGDAGLDLRAAEEVTLRPGRRTRVPLGVEVAIPAGHVGLLIVRSGLAVEGACLVNGIGVIDSGYRGEVAAIMSSAEPMVLRRGERVAQLVVVSFSAVTPVVVDALDATERGEGGFGSSGRE